MSDDKAPTSSRRSSRVLNKNADVRKGSLAAIREARVKGRTFRQRVDDLVQDVYEEVTEEEYSKRGHASDFVVDDDGAGYAVDSDEEDTGFAVSENVHKKEKDDKKRKGVTCCSFTLVLDSRKGALDKFFKKVDNKEAAVITLKYDECLDEMLAQLKQGFEGENEAPSVSEFLAKTTSSTPFEVNKHVAPTIVEPSQDTEVMFNKIEFPTTKRFRRPSPDEEVAAKIARMDSAAAHESFDEPHQLMVMANETKPMLEDVSNENEWGDDHYVLEGSLKDEEEQYDSMKDDSKLLSFFCLDLYENVAGNVFMFGRCGLRSCCLRLTGIERCVYFLPRNENEPFDKLRKEVVGILRQHGINTFKSKEVNVKCVPDSDDLPAESKALIVMYGGNLPKLPKDLTGTCFARVLNTTTSALERLLISTGIRTPCWLKVNNYEEVKDNKKSHCDMEYNVDMTHMNNISVWSERTTPRVKLFALKVVSVPSKGGKYAEIVMISGLYKLNASLDKANDIQRNAYQCVSFVTKPTTGSLPVGLTELLEGNNLSSRVFVLSSERALLNAFLAKLKDMDPDILIMHDSAAQLSLLVNRLENYKINTWSFLSKLRRSTGIDKISKHKNGFWELMAGRLVLCSKTAAEELVHCKSYELDDLVSKLLKSNCQRVVKKTMSPAEIAEPFFTVKGPALLLGLVEWGWLEAYYALRIVLQLNALPLFVNITQIVGGVLSRTLMGGRSERNEFLLLHAFYEKGYIPWDKRASSERMRKQGNGGSEKPPKKVQYTGGLVLEPKRGFYDQYVALLDFNSLYPSIIQEFNICFTTVPKCYEEPDENSLPNPPGKNSPEGILPREIRALVHSRKQVKLEMKTVPLNSDKYQQLNVRQMGLKLTANSMYGCLGFGMSRFCAKKLAAMVTAKGRELLAHTKDAVEKKGYNVVYGDTDSIMVNTNTASYDDARRLAYDLKEQINGIYRTVELDVDGLFKRLLLLKKKKYAALSVSLQDANLLNKELKGLDIIRRDWSQLARDVGSKVVDLILESQDRDQLVCDIVSVLQNVRKSIDENTLDLIQYEIFKQLTKAPNEYNESVALPQVTLAKRLNQTGNFCLKQGDIVKYIVCEDGTNSAASQRVYHITEVMEKKDVLKIDTNYYLSQQVHPVILRLCEPFEELDGCRIAQSLGLDPTHYKTRTINQDQFAGFNLQGSALSDFGLCESFTFRCPHCQKTAVIRGVGSGQGSNIFFALEKCPECHVELLSNSDLLKSRLNQVMNAQITKYNQSPLTCDDLTCSYVERHSNGLRWTTQGPSCSRCKSGIMKKNYSLSDLFQQQNFFLALFDLPRFLATDCPPEQRRLLESTANYEQVKLLYADMKAIVTCRLAHNQFNKIQLSKLLYAFNIDMD